MKATSFILPTVTGVALIMAYLAGQYVGSYDSSKRYALVSERSYADGSAEKLWVAHRAAVFLRDSKPGDALRFLDQYAQVHVEAVAKCLSATDCAAALGSPQRQVELKEIVQARSQSKAGS